MGILDFVKGGVKEMAIARPDSSKDQWVYKHPDQTIPWKAQLTVDSDEIAMFFKNGAYVGSLAAGRHTLDGNNIPFLGQLVDKFDWALTESCAVGMRFFSSRSMTRNLSDFSIAWMNLRRLAYPPSRGKVVP